MKVFFLKDVAKVGRQYEVKKIADGFARNFLIPQKLAEPVTVQNQKKIKVLQEKFKSEIENKKLEAKALIEKLSGKTVAVKAKANEEGHLFAGITADTIAAEIGVQHTAPLYPEYIKLDQPIKELGEHTVEVSNGESKASVIVKVEAE